MKGPSQQTYLRAESWELDSRIWTARLLHAMMRSRIMMCGSPLLLLFPLCVSAETFLDPRPVRPMQACTVSPQGRGLLGRFGGERERARLRLFTVGEACCLWDSCEGQDRSGLWILTEITTREATLSFWIVGFICGFNLTAPWLLKWHSHQVYKLVCQTVVGEVLTSGRLWIKNKQNFYVYVQGLSPKHNVLMNYFFSFK